MLLLAKLQAKGNTPPWVLSNDLLLNIAIPIQRFQG